MWFERVRKLTLALVRVPSVTRTPGERDFIQHHQAMLKPLPYFQAHPEHLRVLPTANDPCGRSALFALVRGTGRKTVLLTGHYDVVSIEDYGDLSPYAFEPQQLLPRLTARLRQGPVTPANRRALEDLESGAFMPGRATLDMKSGLAAGIALLERFSQLPQPEGNLLYLAVPDEEHSSAGMRSAKLQLAQLLAEWDLEVRAAINLDAVTDDGDGALGRTIALGTVGKLLPTVMLVGRPVHASRPFSGVNANLLAAEVIRAIELNPDVADTGALAGEVAPPPVCLRQGDYVAHYDVTTPHLAWCAFNYLTHTLSPQAVFQRVRAAVQSSLESALALLRERAERCGAGDLPDWTPSVLSVAELVDLTSHTAGQDQVQAVLDRFRDLEPLECARSVTAELIRLSHLAGPAAVVGFGSVYYPKTQLSDHPDGPRLEQILREEAARIGAETGRSYGLRPLFPGISDISFLAGSDEPGDLELVEQNTPGFRAQPANYPAMQRLSFPSVNIGPWGRDYHQMLERVHMQDSFELLPELLWRIIGRCLKA